MNMRCPYKVTRNTTTIDKRTYHRQLVPLSLPPSPLSTSIKVSIKSIANCINVPSEEISLLELSLHKQSTFNNNNHRALCLQSCCCLLELLHNSLLTLSYSLLQFLLISDSIPPTKQSDQNQHQRLYIYCCCGWSLSLSYV